MIIDQLPLLDGNVDSNDEIPIERGTTSYKTTQAALVKSAVDAAAAAQTTADNAQTAADDVASSLESYVRPNILGNWYFVGGGSQLGYGVFPINQRGQTSYINVGYAIDRWKINNALTMKVQSDGLSLTAANIATIQQSLDAKSLRGLRLTASALCSSVTGSFHINIRINGAVRFNSRDITSAGITLISFTVPADADTIIFEPRCAANTSVVIAAMKLEIDDTQTLAHQESGAWVLNEVPDYAEQLEKCQAYYIKMPYVTEYSCSLGLDGSNPRITIPLPATMAKTPTFTKIGADGFQFGVGASRVSVGGSSDSIQISGNYGALLFPNAVRINFQTSASIGTALLPCVVELPAFELSAE